MNVLSGLRAIPPAGRTAVLVGVAAILVGGAYFLGGGLQGSGIVASLVALAGVGLIIALLFVYSKVLALLDRRKSTPFAAKLRQNTAAVPQGISDPSHRAQLDDIRKKFERGLDVFKEHGKDLYSMPWYLLVGEPGSGKTEMIRRCNVGFPPGLQDTLQGTGGTVNMNWWFTNHAVILDTAGKLIFDQAPPGQTTVWKELLTLLRKGRPSCPINGMLLVIPADTLIMDSEEQILGKAGRIAEQLDGIQRVLGVRFPVFVVITKCDKINGFREFFDGIRDPQLQNQILGWSNPADLDAPFSPEAVDQHLQTVQGRLRRRRLGLLLDPVHSDDPVNGKRIDQVDAMYAFPEGIMQIAPRLRRYLETIFVAGAWSTKPLFLRGIYFNSALREGDALDADLAAMFNLPPDQLPEGRVWERERSYFIRDLLMTKVFRERGLVTRANSAKKVQRQRMGIVLGAASLALVLSIAIVTISGVRFKSRIGVHRDFWSTVADAVLAPKAAGDTGVWEVVAERSGVQAISNPRWWNQSIQSRLENVVGADGMEDLRYSAVVASVAERASRPIEIPVEFKWLSAFGIANPAERQRDAAQTVVDVAIMSPLVRGVRARIDRGDALPPDAIAELVRLEREAAAIPARSGESEWAMGTLLMALDPRLVQGDEVISDREPLGVEAVNVDRAVRALYGQRVATWPPPNAPWAASGAGLASIERAVTLLCEGASPADRAQTGIKAIGDFVAAAAAFEAAEQGTAGLLGLQGLQVASSRAEHARVVASWDERLSLLRRSAESMAAALVPVKDLEGRPAEEWITNATRQAVDDASARLAPILAQTPAQGPAQPQAPSPSQPPPQASGDAGGAASGPQARLAAIAALLTAELAEAESNARKSLGNAKETIENAQRQSLRKIAVDGTEMRLFEARLSMYNGADSALKARDTLDSISALGDAITAVNSAGRDARASVERVAGAAGAEELVQRAARLANAAIDASGARRRSELVEAAIARIESEDPVAIAGAVATGGAAGPIEIARVPMSSLGGERIDERFSPKSATQVFAAFAGVQGVLDTGLAATTESPVMDARALRERWSGARSRIETYIGDYLGAWLHVYERSRTIDPALRSWADAAGALSSTSARDINAALAAALIQVRAAFDAIPESSRTSDPRVVGATTRLNAEIAQLDGPSREAFTARAERSRTELLAMTSEPMAAREAVLAFRPSDFQTTVLAACPASIDDPNRVELWDRIVLGSIELLANDTASGVREASATVLELSRRAPISRDSDAALTFEEIESLNAAVKRLMPGDPEAAAGDTIGSGAPVARADVATLLSRVAGPDLLRRQRALLTRGRQIAEIFSPGLEYEILTLESQPSPGAHQNWPFVRTHTAAGTSEWRPLAANRETGVRIPVKPGATLTLEFSRTEAKGGIGANVITTPDGWTLALTAIQKGRQDPSRTNVWIVPLDFGGQPLEIGVKFSRPMPVEARWPRTAEWPDPLTLNPG